MLARLLLQPLIGGHSTGKSVGGGFDDQSVLMSPAVVSWKATVPTLVGASAGLSWPTVVQASVNERPDCSFTVTFSFTGDVV